MMEMLLERYYTPGIIDTAISKTKAIFRDQTLKLVLRQPIQQRLICVVSYNPRLPSIPGVTKKHWRSKVSQDNYQERVFPEPPLIAFKRQKNLRETLIRAKCATPPTRQEKKKQNEEVRKMHNLQLCFRRKCDEKWKIHLEDLLKSGHLFPLFRTHCPMMIFLQKVNW